MNDVLNVILIHTNYFKNILISDDYQFLINLSLINKKYFKMINDVYKNYILNEFPELKKFDNLTFGRFGCVSWIHLYSRIFTSILRQIIFRNIVIESDISLPLNGDIYLIKSFDRCSLIPFSINGDKTSLFSVDYHKIKLEIHEFLNFNDIFENQGVNSSLISSVMGRFLFQTDEITQPEKILDKTTNSKFLRKICSIYNQPSTYDVILNLMTKDKLKITESSIHIVF